MTTALLLAAVLNTSDRKTRCILAEAKEPNVLANGSIGHPGSVGQLIQDDKLVS